MAGSRLQDVHDRGLAADRPLATDVSPGTLYFSSDTLVLERVDDTGTTWETYSPAGGGGGESLVHQFLLMGG